MNAATDLKRKASPSPAASIRARYGAAVLRGSARLGEWLVDLVFPPVCSRCGRVDAGFCERCLDELAAAPVIVRHKRAECLDAIISTGPHRGVLRSALLALKYEGATELAPVLARRLALALRRQNLQVDALLPVPLYADRQLERGYNQSSLLCAALAADLSLQRREDLLSRVSATKQQTRLSPAERMKNVKDAFRASRDCAGLSLLLVDDVVTSGATMNACASALRRQGAGAVYGIAVSGSP